jgi:hypothetical protein
VGCSRTIAGNGPAGRQGQSCAHANSAQKAYLYIQMNIAIVQNNLPSERGS